MGIDRGVLRDSQQRWSASDLIMVAVKVRHWVNSRG